MRGERFTLCPQTPNCVSSKQPAGDRHVAPLSYIGDSEAAWERLLTLLEGHRRVRVVEQEEQYIHAVFRSPVFRFADDVEFQLDTANHLIHIKSASRVGMWDLGVNRRRCESIRKEFNFMLNHAR